MKKHTYIFVLVLFSTLFACRKDHSVQLSFTGTYGDSPMVLYKENKMADNKTMHISLSEFFLSDIKLVDDQGTEHLLSEASFVSFKNSTDESKAKKAVQVLTKVVDPNKYMRLKFGIGVKPSLNSKKPEDFPANSPLREMGFHWPSWKSFIFTKTEGQIDGNADGTPNVGYVYHTGGDTVYQEITLDISGLSFSDNQLDIQLNLDHKKALNPGGQAFDILKNPVIHTAAGLETLIAYSKSFGKAIEIK